MQIVEPVAYLLSLWFFDDPISLQSAPRFFGDGERDPATFKESRQPLLQLSGHSLGTKRLRQLGLRERLARKRGEDSGFKVLS